MTEVNKTQLAKKLGVSSAMVSKHVKSGILDKCFTPNGKKIYLEKAIKSIELSKKREVSNNLFEVTTPKEIINNKTIVNDEAREELQGLLTYAQSPSQKVQIIKEFWAGKINRQKFLQAEAELITVYEAKSVIEKIFVHLNQYLNDQASNIKNNFPDLPLEISRWIDDENNKQKEQLRIKNWEN